MPVKGGRQFCHRADLFAGDDKEFVTQGITDNTVGAGGHRGNDRCSWRAEHLPDGNAARSPRQAVKPGIATHPEPSVHSGGGAPGADNLRCEGIQIAALRIPCQDAAGSTYDELFPGGGDEAVAVFGKAQPLHPASLYAGNVPASGQIGLIADDGSPGFIVIGFAFSGKFPVHQHLAVQRSHHQMPVRDGRCPDDIVPVQEASPGETTVVEAVEALIGGRPEAVPAVDE